MANRQWDNLIVILVLYVVVRAISSYFEKVTSGYSEFLHYVLLGYFSAKYWIFIIVLAIVTDIVQYKIDFMNMNVISAKFIGLLAGISLNRMFPLKINLWRIIKEIFALL